MKVSKLRSMLARAPDNAVVVVRTRDHSYREAHATEAAGLFSPESGWTEDQGEDTTPEGEYGRRWPIIVID